MLFSCDRFAMSRELLFVSANVSDGAGSGSCGQMLCLDKLVDAGADPEEFGLPEFLDMEIPVRRMLVEACPPGIPPMPTRAPPRPDEEVSTGRDSMCCYCCRRIPICQPKCNDGSWSCRWHGRGIVAIEGREQVVRRCASRHTGLDCAAAGAVGGDRLVDGVAFGSRHRIVRPSLNVRKRLWALVPSRLPDGSGSVTMF